MATTKITDLTAYTDPVNTDVLPIVDITSDVTKKVSIANVMKNASFGSASAPGVAFDGNSACGLYSSGTNQVGLATAGTARLTIDSSGNVSIPQNVTTTGTSTAASFIPSSSTAPTNGVYLPAANTVGISTNGTKRIEIQADGDIDIDNGGVFYDATNNRLAIGTTSPATALHVIGDAASAEIRLGVTGNANRAFLNYTESGFLTTLDGDGPIRFSPNNTEAARLDLSGRLLVGTSSSLLAYSKLQVQGGISDGGGHICLANDNASPANGVNIGSVRFTNNAGGIGAIIGCEADGAWTAGSNYRSRLVFSTTADGASSPTERMRITNDGRVLLGATTGDSGLVVDRAVSRAALGTTAPGRIYTGASTITDNTTVASGTVAHGTIVSFDNPAIAATNASVTYTRASTLYVDGAPTAGTNVTISNRYGLFVNGGNSIFGENVTIGGAVVPASATASLSLINGTIPSASVVNGVSLYAEDVSASSELKVRDEAGNITTLSPHNFSLIPEGPSEEMAWAFYSERDGTKINVDMLKAIRLLEQLTGEQLVYLSEAQ